MRTVVATNGSAHRGLTAITEKPVLDRHGFGASITRDGVVVVTLFIECTVDTREWRSVGQDWVLNEEPHKPVTGNGVAHGRLSRAVPSGFDRAQRTAPIMVLDAAVVALLWLEVGGEVRCDDRVAATSRSFACDGPFGCRVSIAELLFQIVKLWRQHVSVSISTSISIDHIHVSNKAVTVCWYVIASVNNATKGSTGRELLQEFLIQRKIGWRASEVHRDWRGRGKSQTTTKMTETELRGPRTVVLSVTFEIHTNIL